MTIAIDAPIRPQPPEPQFSLSSPQSNEPVSSALVLQIPKIKNQWKYDTSRFVPIIITVDTMTPTLRIGDVAFVDCTDIRLTDGLFALSFHDGHQTVKRVDRRSKDVVRLIHDNHLYDPIDINLNDPQDGFQVIGRVVWTACRV